MGVEGLGGQRPEGRVSGQPGCEDRKKGALEGFVV